MRRWWMLSPTCGCASLNAQRLCHTRGLQEGTRRLQQLANRSSNILSISAEEARKAVQNIAEEVTDETEEKVKTARRRS